MPKSKNTFHIESALAELEALVAKMEKGQLSLEDSLASFEKGIQLTKDCQKALTDAERKVKILTESSDQNTLNNFDTSTLENDDAS